MDLFNPATKTSGDSYVYRLVAGSLVRQRRLIADDSCVSPVVTNGRQQDTHVSEVSNLEN
ncbi:hypothetical protein F7734_00795 [Scytonema sp. UIC 10036]|uniref:hypothetical protein n=1 Tax=Scytonema sp. UIC 10036 TaxID=2304196 RepID=UPI0012DA9B8E|nr:hypothetical protein [Scytonema sp. UIC 10036]MUG91114.1 hypothetical protein [Scytonema sp. UIC 10036]